LARIRVDQCNARAQNSKMKELLQETILGLKEKDKLIERYEVEIRRRNDEIERKQSEVDRLNKKYDVLASNMKVNLQLNNF
jgi:coiled-coil domain-containing protein 40